MAVLEPSHKPRAYYFGCWDPRHAGHGFHAPGGRTDRSANGVVPWTMSEVDGGLAPRVAPYGREPTRRDPECSQGVARLHYRDGWTALSFWDRTGDSRGGSHSTFLLECRATFDEMVAMARERFPQMMDRLPFAVVPCRRNAR